MFKNIFDLITSAGKAVAIVSILLVIGCAVLFPEAFSVQLGDRLKRAGLEIKEIILPGVKFALIEKNDQLEKNSEDLTLASAEINRLKDIIECLTTSDQCAEDNQEKIHGLIQDTASFQRDIQQAIKANETAVASGPQYGNFDDSDWFVVFGADDTSKAAEVEIGRVESLHANSLMVERDGWFRSVVPFDTRELASANVDEISELAGRTAYIRSVSTWCPGAIFRDGSDQVVKC